MLNIYRIKFYLKRENKNLEKITLHFVLLRPQYGIKFKFRAFSVGEIFDPPGPGQIGGH